MRRYLIKELVGLLVMGAALFVSAGSWRWPAAWGYLGLVACSKAVVDILLARRSPELLEERSGVRQGAKGYDIPLAILMAYGPLLQSAAAGLQFRLGETVDVPPLMWAAAAVVALGCSCWILWAMLSNPFFAPVVRIQTERGHVVIQRGPYGYIRHPGYVGAMVFSLTVPALLGSTWALAVAAITVLGAVLRTALEDRVLRRELPGYAEYCLVVRYRLLPGLW